MKLLKFASIDVGSNAVRLLFTNVFETDEGPVYRKLSLVRVPIRLGEDAFEHGLISDKKAEQLVNTMRSFKHLMEVHQVQAYKAYATSAMREAANSEEIVKTIKVLTDLDLEIVSGDIEANTISTESMPEPLPKFKEAVFVDVGGGSTEMTLLKEGHKVSSVSFKIGTIRMLHNGVSSELWSQFDDWFKSHNLIGSQVPLIGTGGNINKLLKILREESTDYHISVRSLEDFLSTLEDIPYDERIVKYILNPDRADVIVHACKIFVKAAANLGSKNIHIPKVGLSDGIARSLYKEFKKALL
ncbi:MAG: exopolyphosphatase [Bacteroidia bacterium]